MRPGYVLGSAGLLSHGQQAMRVNSRPHKPHPALVLAQSRPDPLPCPPTALPRQALPYRRPG